MCRMSPRRAWWSTRSAVCMKRGVSVPFAANVSALANWKGTAPLIILNVDQFSAAELATLRHLHERGVRMAMFAEDGAVPAAVSQWFDKAPESVLIQASAESFTEAQARQVVPGMIRDLQVPLRFPSGTAGYGFDMQGLHFVVVEDWLESGRMVAVRLRASPGARTARACDVNEHLPLAVHRDGNDWVVETPLRPGDGALIALEESN